MNTNKDIQQKKGRYPGSVEDLAYTLNLEGFSTHRCLTEPGTSCNSNI